MKRAGDPDFMGIFREGEMVVGLGRCGRFAGLFSLVIVGIMLVAPRVEAQEIQVSGGLDDVNVYVAEGGDSLWDIADRFFSDPWYWPTLWSFNPHITNPNWIFPGDKVYLVPPKPVKEQKGGYSLSESRFAPGVRDELALGRRVGFLTEDQYKGSGVVANSREDKLMLGERDDVYVKFDTARRINKGDLVLIYRQGKKMKHPVTKKKIGYEVKYLGMAKITDTDNDLNKGVIMKAFEEIYRGDKVAPFAPIQRMVPPVPNSKDLEGFIVSSLDGVHFLGEYHYVLVDKGSKDGVMAGNRFMVVTKGDGVEKFNPKKKKLAKFPEEDYGELLVIEARDSTSLCIVTYANREFEVGSKIKMPAGY
jgi:hypothetical protein